MSAWTGLDPALFDSALRPAKPKHGAVSIDQGSLFESSEIPGAPEPQFPAPPGGAPDLLPGESDLFGGEAHGASVPRGAMCRCSAPATGPVDCGPGGLQFLCDDCRRAEIRACHEPGPHAPGSLYTVCRKCGHSIAYRAEIHRYVVATTGNHECYGRP